MEVWQPHLLGQETSSEHPSSPLQPAYSHRPFLPKAPAVKQQEDSRGTLNFPHIPLGPCHPWPRIEAQT